MQNVMSALPPKADMCGALCDVRFVPIADIGYRSRKCLSTSRLARLAKREADLLSLRWLLKILSRGRNFRAKTATVARSYTWQSDFKSAAI
jgi:hypothetical protein